MHYCSYSNYACQLGCGDPLYEAERRGLRRADNQDSIGTVLAARTRHLRDSLLKYALLALIRGVIPKHVVGYRQHRHELRNDEEGVRVF